MVEPERLRPVPELLMGERPAAARARDDVAARPGAVGGLEGLEGLRVVLAPDLGVPDEEPRRSPHVAFLAVGRLAGEGEGLAEAPPLDGRLPPPHPPPPPPLRHL